MPVFRPVIAEVGRPLVFDRYAGCQAHAAIATDEGRDRGIHIARAALDHAAMVLCREYYPSMALALRGNQNEN
jgi:hypothetical protein